MGPKADLSIYKVPGVPALPAVQQPSATTLGHIKEGSDKLWDSYKSRNLPDDLNAWSQKDWETGLKHAPDKIEAWQAREDFMNVKNRSKSLEYLAEAGGFANLTKEQREHIQSTSPDILKQALEFEKSIQGLSEGAYKNHKQVMTGMGSMIAMMADVLGKAPDKQARGDAYKQLKQHFAQKFPGVAEQVFGFIDSVIPALQTGASWDGEIDDGRLRMLTALGGAVSNYGGQNKKELTFDQQNKLNYAKTLPPDKAREFLAGVPQKQPDQLSQKEQGVKDFANMVSKVFPAVAQRLMSGESLNDIIVEDQVSKKLSVPTGTGSGLIPLTDFMKAVKTGSLDQPQSTVPPVPQQGPASQNESNFHSQFNQATPQSNQTMNATAGGGTLKTKFDGVVKSVDMKKLNAKKRAQFLMLQARFNRSKSDEDKEKILKKMMTYKTGGGS